MNDNIELNEAKEASRYCEAQPSADWEVKYWKLMEENSFLLGTLKRIANCKQGDVVNYIKEVDDLALGAVIRFEV